jgi:putative membrane protein
MSFFIRVIVNAVAMWLTTLLLGDHFEIVGGTGTGGKVVVFLVVALIFGIVNAIVKPIVQFFSIPLYILTLGLFTLVVNALMLMLTGWLTEQSDWGLRVNGFWWAVLAALIISVLSMIISAVIPGSSKKNNHRQAIAG